VKRLGDNLLAVLVFFVLGCIGWVIFVGGILCLRETSYTFDNYLSDLTRLHGLLVAAIVGAIARELLPAIERRNGNGHKE
jgi:hypothetical protein